MASSKPSKKESKKAVASKPSKGSKTAAKPKETSRSTERIADSDIDMDDASSEEGSDSNDEAGSAAGPDEETSSSGSSSESESGSGSGSESEEELPVKVTAPTTTLPKRSKNPSPAPTPALQHTSTRPAPFAPPKGYTPLPASFTTNSLLTPAALANKQIWHITAPASLSLSSLKNLSLPATGAKDGDAPTISLPGGKYTVALAASTADTTRVLVPNRGGYKALAAPVGQTLHLQRVNEVGGEKYEVRKREARKQPGGLKMRFRPIGFGEAGECGEIGEADEEEEGERPQFKKHKKSGGGEVEEGEKEKERREKKERKAKKEKGKGKEKKVRKEK